MDSGDEDLDRIRKSLEQKLEYQTDQMVKSIMGIVRTNTIDVIKVICSGLGRDWHLGGGMIVIKQEGDTKHAVHYGVHNNVDTKLNVTIVVNPDLVDNKLVIRFREGTETFDTFTQDLTTGVDWEQYRNILKQHYKDRLSKKIE